MCRTVAHGVWQDGFIDRSEFNAILDSQNPQVAAAQFPRVDCVTALRCTNIYVPHVRGTLRGVASVGVYEGGRRSGSLSESLAESECEHSCLIARGGQGWPIAERAFGNCPHLYLFQGTLARVSAEKFVEDWPPWEVELHAAFILKVCDQSA